MNWTEWTAVVSAITYELDNDRLRDIVEMAQRQVQLNDELNEDRQRNNRAGQKRRA